MVTYDDILKKDAKELGHLDRECFSVPWSEKAFSDEAENEKAIYVVAKENNKILGYAGLWKVLDEGQITNIAVRKKLRRQGIAENMLRELLKKATSQDIKRLSLEVRKSNEAAIGLYSKMGFFVVGERKNYYHEPTENAILMDLELKGNENG